MNTGQTMLTIGAMVLLGYTVLMTNRSNLTHGIILQQTEIGVYMVSLAISRLEEATGKAFDEETAGGIVTGVSQLTHNNDFGPDDFDEVIYEEGPPELGGTETIENYNDFDDYNGYVEIDTIPAVGILSVGSYVRYVNPANPDSVLSSGTRTYHKRMDVVVINVSSRDTTTYIPNDTLRMSYIFSYWTLR